MNSRVAELRRLAGRARCTAVLVSSPVDVEYVSGFRATNAYLLISSRRGILFTDFRYRSAAQRFCSRRREWRFVEVGESSFEAIARAVKPGDRVGIQSGSLTVDQYDRLRRKCRHAKLVKLGNAISSVNAVKLPGEIAAMHRAARIGDRALAAFARDVRPGMSEIAAARMLDDLCAEGGSEGPSFETIVLFGPRTALPHGRPSQRKLHKGDWVLCDFGCTVDGLYSDMTRTMVAGMPSEKQKRIYDIVYRAQRAARRAVKAGIRSCDVDARARGVIADAGYGDAFGHATGHGVGRRIHERPRLGRNDKTILTENMVVTVEPGIYVPGEGGVRIEDMVAVTPRGGRCLTHAPRELIELGFRT
ncbi:MAG: M24 family metallopeptidase [Chitinivibrionales bacterium]|nr:M24 family metallopeptidase [Chitinivibrionales bacterium]MBD3397241.1 M24 family metallopeptidase [Chitinivibrionales bacterium]